MIEIYKFIVYTLLHRKMYSKFILKLCNVHDEKYFLNNQSINIVQNIYYKAKTLI